MTQRAIVPKEIFVLFICSICMILLRYITHYEYVSIGYVTVKWAADWELIWIIILGIIAIIIDQPK